jgi:hypothetical protein
MSNKVAALAAPVLKKFNDVTSKSDKISPRDAKSIVESTRKVMTQAAKSRMSDDDFQDLEQALPAYISTQINFAMFRSETTYRKMDDALIQLAGGMVDGGPARSY